MFPFSDEGTDITKVLDSLIQDISTKKRMNHFRQAQQVAIIISDGKRLEFFDAKIHIFILTNFSEIQAFQVFSKPLLKKNVILPNPSLPHNK